METNVKLPFTFSNLPTCFIPASEQDSKQQENNYNSRVLIHNWYEDRRQYRQDCPRCTGTSIYKGDYLPHSTEDIKAKKSIPPPIYEMKAKVVGAGSRLLFNDYDYCDYLENYMTTYDLVHNWEIRRAGCKSKPYRKWKLGLGGYWEPQPDNALPFGNLTTIGFRQSPQLPMVPKDWQTYQKDTTYQRQFVPRKYPNDYVLCRYAAPKAIHKGTEDMSLIPREGLCASCRFNACIPHECGCSCHIRCRKNDTPRFPTLISTQTTKQYPPCQDVLPSGMKGNPVLKHPPHAEPCPGYPIYESTVPDPCDQSDVGVAVQYTCP